MSDSRRNARQEPSPSLRSLLSPLGSSKSNHSQPSRISEITQINPTSEINRLQSELAEIDRDIERLQQEVAATGNPIHRIALVATRAARQATSGTLDVWAELVAGDTAVVAA